jgi:hypothetical protein
LTRLLCAAIDPLSEDVELTQVGFDEPNSHVKPGQLIVFAHRCSPGYTFQHCRDSLNAISCWALMVVGVSALDPGFR